ncbi:MAG: rhodanese-like domain-containing protein [Cyanobacteria bacterium P01_A01_bin.40]
MTIFSKFFPIPEEIQYRSSVSTLKKRLDWGEPALTIIDARSRVLFDINHILGSISMPMNEPNDLTLASLELSRDLYVYADTDKETAIAAQNLRHHGYQKVSELIGGLDAWKKANYPIVGY